jgi:EmrB/QacA subfamily drug resistance transporter
MICLMSRKTKALVFIGLAQLVAALDATIVNVALPSAQAGLHLSNANRQWVITAYTLAFAGFVLVGGRVADYAGRKRAFVLALVGFAVASAVGGAAVSGAMLIAARAVQGLFAAILAPTTLSLLAVTFSEARERAKAFAVYGAIAGSGAAIGLVLGGALTEYLSWRWCLYVNVPIAAVAATGGWRTLPVLPAHRDKLDVGGVALSTVGLVALVEACARATTDDWSSAPVVGLLVTAAALLAAFVGWERRASSPVMPLRIAGDRRRIGAYLAVFAAMGGMLAAFLALTYTLQVVMGYSPVMTGLAFLPLSAAVQVGAGGIATRLMPKVQARVLVVPGLLVAAAGMAWLSRLHVGAAYPSHVLPTELLLGLGMGLIFVPAIATAQAGVDQREAGIASAILNATQQAGGSIGTALLNSVATSAAVSYAVTHHSGPAALVHGYSTAARWTGAGLVCVAAAVYLLLRPTKGEEVTVQLNHTIVAARDKHSSAAFLAEVIGVPVGPDNGPFVPITLANGVTLDYDDRFDVVPQHYAFLVDDETFDRALEKLRRDGTTIWADPGHHEPGEINTRWGGRGFYFEDPNGHNMELLTKA